MIVVWPLVVSKTVNPNVLPGICKALEKYVHIEETDKIIEMANEDIKKRNKKNRTFQLLKNIGGKLRLSECDEIEYNNYLEEAKKTDPRKGPQPKKTDPRKGPQNNTLTNVNVSTKSPQPPTQKPQTPVDHYQKGKDEARGRASARPTYAEAPVIGRVESQAISTEPTWNSVTDQQGNVSAIGVKVVPFVIENEQSLIKLMTLDRYRSSLSKDLHKQSRKLLRIMQKIANIAWKSTIGKLLSWTGFVDKDLVAGTVTQNWKNDIILQNTAFGENMFICLNKLDLKEDFTENAKGVKKLFTLGWTSFIIADDINNVAHFCMKTYKGMCSMVNYGFLYADARSQSQVYQDISDVRRNAGPMFRMKRRKKSMINDSLAQYKLDQFSSDVLLAETSTISESAIPDLVNKVKKSPKELASSMKAMQSAFKRKDYKGAYKIAQKINPSRKKLELSKLLNKTIKTDSEFKKNYDLSYRIFKNSIPGLSEELLKVGSGLMASVAAVSKNKKYNIKDDIKKVVLQTRSYQSLDKDNDDFEKDLKFAFSFAILSIIFVGLSSIFIINGLIDLIGITSYAISTLAPIVLIFVVALYGLKILAAGRGGGDDD